MSDKYFRVVLSMKNKKRNGNKKTIKKNYRILDIRYLLNIYYSCENCY